MNHLLVLALLCTLLPFWGLAQKKAEKRLDEQDFAAKAALADWLLAYDAMAWQSADSVLALPDSLRQRLGNDWFCFQRPDGSWHAVYGRYQQPAYELIAHYQKKPGEPMTRSSQPPPAAFLAAHARALQTAGQELRHLKASINIRFNHYIRQQPDSSLVVWIFPAFQPNGLAVYGGEFCYTLDAQGERILKDESYSQGLFRAFKVGQVQEARLAYPDLPQPSLGSVFFAWYYKKLFGSIHIESQYHTSTPLRSPEGHYHWVHQPHTEQEKGH